MRLEIASRLFPFMAFGIILVMIAMALWLKDARPVLPPTGLDIVRQTEYPDYGKLTLILHQDGTCVLAGDRWALYAPSSWCE